MRLRPSAAGRRSAGVPGFTLVEVLVAGALGAIVLAAAYSVLSSGLDLAAEIDGNAQTTRDAQLATTLLRTDIERSQRAVVTAGRLRLETSGGDSTVYTWMGVGAPLVRTGAKGAGETLAVSLDEATFALVATARPTVTEERIGVVSYIASASFSPGDWDSLVAASQCDYSPQVLQDIDGIHRVAEEFTASSNQAYFAKVRVRLSAPVRTPAADLRVEVFASQAAAPKYPETLLASGSLSRTVLTTVPTWFEIPLVQATTYTVRLAGEYWLILRGLGGNVDYAATVNVETLQSCKTTDLPKDTNYYRTTSDGGASWTARTAAQESFFAVYAGATTGGVVEEVSATVADTTGVSYVLAVSGGTQVERRMGHVSLHPR